MSQAGILNVAGGGGGGSPVQTLTGDTGGAVPPTANNINLIGGPGVSVTGNAGISTLTINLTNVTPNYVNVTPSMSPYVVQANDYFISCDTTGAGGPAPITIRLPNSPTQYDQFVVKDRTGGAAANNITITTVGGAVTIDGDTSVIFTDDYESLELLFNATSYETF